MGEDNESKKSKSNFNGIGFGVIVGPNVNAGAPAPTALHRNIITKNITDPVTGVKETIYDLDETLLGLNYFRMGATLEEVQGDTWHSGIITPSSFHLLNKKVDGSISTMITPAHIDLTIRDKNKNTETGTNIEAGGLRTYDGEFQTNVYGSHQFFKRIL